jgi:hypothetical protein
MYGRKLQLHDRRISMEETASAAVAKRSHLGAILATALAAIVCGATFLFALFRQFALVEVTASLATCAEVFFLSSSIGDLLEDKPEPNGKRLAMALGLAAALVLYFLVARLRASTR